MFSWGIFSCLVFKCCYKNDVALPSIMNRTTNTNGFVSSQIKRLETRLSKTECTDNEGRERKDGEQWKQDSCTSCECRVCSHIHTTPQHLKYCWALKLLLRCEHLSVLPTFSFFHTLFTIYSFISNTFQRRLLAEETAARCQTSDLPQSCLSLRPAFCCQPSKFILPSR